jgi:hydrogenase expression/formation protein HypD
MKYVDEYRDAGWIRSLLDKLGKFPPVNRTFMEVCGGHTMAIHRFGLPSLLPDHIRLVSGPGCPVCVTPRKIIDQAVEYARQPGFVITTYGDVMRVPGSFSSLDKERSAGKDVRIVFSPMEALRMAELEFPKKIIFLGIGFETTTPGSAVTILEAERKGVTNFFLLSAHKVMPPAMRAIIEGGTAIDGFICPGHVCTIAGTDPFGFIPAMFRLPCIVTGFEPVDILQALVMLMTQIEKNEPGVDIQYKRAVTPEGNLIARKYMEKVFYLDNAEWRGLGKILLSGWKLRKEYERFDIEKVLPTETEFTEAEDECLCGEILRGLKTPAACRLFSVKCNPENPVGACMVSAEGACQIYYRYSRNG